MKEIQGKFSSAKIFTDVVDEKSIERDGYGCIGKPEPLKGDLSGWWSVRVDDANRIVFRIDGEVLTIYSCAGHYED